MSNAVHKTFVSYKYSESQDLRDKIIEVLGDDATYYKFIIREKQVNL